MIKAVLFDFGQTLVDSAEGFRAAEKDAQKKIFAELALTGWDDFLASYRKIREDFHRRSQFSRRAVWQEVYWHYCREADEKLLEKWEQQYWQIVRENTSLFPETLGLLQSLSERYKLGLITNTQGQKSAGRHRLEMYPELEKFFQVVMVAGEGGLAPKPAPAVFQVCLERLAVAAGEAVYVGDDYHIDIGGAEAAGVKAIWLKHHSVRRNWPDVKTAVPVITSLEELLDLDKIIG